MRTRLTNDFLRGKTYNLGRDQDLDDLASLRDRARRVDQANPVGHSLLNTEVDCVIGNGLNVVPRATRDDGTEADDFNGEVSERWEQWWETADVRRIYRTPGEVQRAVYRSARRDGDDGTVLVGSGDSPSRIQFVASDLIETPLDKYGDPRIRHGVRFNDVAAPLLYYVKTLTREGNQTYTPVGYENFLHLANRHYDVYAARGISCFAQAFALLDHLDQYTESVAIAAWMGAVFGLVIKDEAPHRQVSGLGQARGSDGEMRSAVTYENGMMRYVGPQGGVMQVDAKQPMSQTPEFARMLIRLIGLVLDMPLEFAAHDFSKANFSVSRIAGHMYWKSVGRKRDWFGSQWLSPLYRWWLSREVKYGRITSPVPRNYWAHKINGAPPVSADPLREAQGLLLQRDMGQVSDYDIATALGNDYDRTQAEIAAAERARVAHGRPAQNLLGNFTRAADQPPAVSPFGETPITDDEGEEDED